MTSSEIKATVIVAAWKAADQLPRSVGSALAQTGVTVEVVIVDDASPDDTFARAEELARDDPRIRVLRLTRNGGPSAARNAALEVARGEWVAVLDADDTMAPDRLAAMIALGEARGADAVFDDLQPVDAAGHPLGPTHLAPLDMQGPEAWSLERFLAGCQARPGEPSLGYLKPVLRRAFLDRHGIRYDTALRNGEDFHLIAALLAQGGRLWALPEARYRYTRQTGSISARLNPDHARALDRADAAFMDRHGAHAGVKRLMRRRRHRLASLSTAEDIMVALKTRRPAAAIRALASRPSAAPRLMRQLAEAISRRLAR
ncbi:glycosyltransferase [Jannaschia sp. S6380]|uniref:glycosyltransferase family 2 protein n=1 Tax=Jannaschia sp. S6380 TaxID=2926408 RepID=UPI001FF150AF|nr:glycosyltransferase family 2 protein [Jannaschia sp. S6380]MCK0168491.1 glycosyltransferase [Jannaschia sp. S6380]